MKSQNYGYGRGYHAVLGGTRRRLVPITHPSSGCSVAQKNFRENRENGEPRDNPDRDLPLDGKAQWVKCQNETDLPREGDVKYGEQGTGYYRPRYDEGPGDKAWMEEKDRNYLARLLREGKHDEIEHLGGRATLIECLGEDGLVKLEAEASRGVFSEKKGRLKRKTFGWNHEDLLELRGDEVLAKDREYNAPFSVAIRAYQKTVEMAQKKTALKGSFLRMAFVGG